MLRLIVEAMAAWDRSNHRANSYEIFGVDVMLDADLRPWLIEVNNCPGLKQNSEVVKAHHPRMLKSALAQLFDAPWAWTGTELERDAYQWRYVEPPPSGLAV